MKKSMRIGSLAAAVCLILGAWAVTFGLSECKKAEDSEATLSSSLAVQTVRSDAAVDARSTTTTTASATGTAIFQKSDLFTDRDLKQEADLSEAVTLTVSDGQDMEITQAGVYVLTGTAKDASVLVAADKEDKVQLVLDGLTISNSSAPAIYVKSADKVFVTTASASSLSVTGTFAADGDTNLDGVIFSKSDLILNGTADLAIDSTKNGVVGKDDLKITGGTYTISAKVKAVEANDSIRIADGTLKLTAGTDGLHAENDDDSSKGYIYIGGGTVTILAGDDGIHATTVAQVDDGTVSVTASEGIEATYVQLNGGTIAIDSRDDGINAAKKSSAYRATVEINGGDITVTMASGDTDGVDSNGDIIVNGGTIRVTGNSTFDCDGSAQYNGGTIIANGQQIDYIPNQMFGGRGGQGGFDGWGGFGESGNNPGDGSSGAYGGQGGFGGRGGRGGRWH